LDNHYGFIDEYNFVHHFLYIYCKYVCDENFSKMKCFDVNFYERINILVIKKYLLSISSLFFHVYINNDEFHDFIQTLLNYHITKGNYQVLKYFHENFKIDFTLNDLYHSISFHNSFKYIYDVLYKKNKKVLNDYLLYKTIIQHDNIILFKIVTKYNLNKKTKKLLKQYKPPSIIKYCYLNNIFIL